MIKVNKKLKRHLKLPLYRYQRDGVRFIEKCEGRAMLFDDMGVGKTPQSIAWAAIHPEIRPVVVVCPSTMKWTWQREWEKFAGLPSYVCEGELPSPEALSLSLTRRRRRARRIKNPKRRRERLRAIRRSAKLRRRDIKRRKEEAAGASIIIINYDIAADWTPFLLELGPQLLILDECHRVTNRSAQCTKACKKLSRAAPYVIALSGTPFAGKPAQLFPILQMVRPREFPSFWKYAFEYCAPTKNRWGGGWSFEGASNMDSLRRRLRKFMLRRMKQEVLKNLPKKVRTVIPVDIKNRAEYDEAEENFLTWLKQKRGEGALKRAQRAEAIVKLGAMKLLAAEGKLDYAVQWIREFLKESDHEKLLVFAVHKKVLKRLRKEFPKSLLIDGSVSNKVKKGQAVSPRQAMVDRFQKSKKHRLLFGQLKAAGQGITLTAGANVLKLELGWNPGDHDQAEDRALRIGQTRQVNVYYLVGKDTIEERILAILQSKDKVVGRVLDGRKGATMKLLDQFLKEAS